MRYGLAMPIFLRGLFLPDLHHMCLYFEEQGGFRGDIAAFKRVVPAALSAEDWFRFHGRCVRACVRACVCARAPCVRRLRAGVCPAPLPRNGRWSIRA